MFCGMEDCSKFFQGRLLAYAVTLLLTLSFRVGAEDWPSYRGPKHNGVSSEKGWNDQWPDEGPKIRWKAAVGLGFSGMVVAEGRLFSVGHANDSDTIYCLDAE